MTSQDPPQENGVSHIETPVLSVDESLSTEERLTDNTVENILPARYLLDDETPDDMFRRVAENVAKAEDDATSTEAWEKAFYDVMSTQQFIPNCVAPTTTVGTPSGNKTITDIDEGETVSDDTGTGSVAETFDNGRKQMQTISVEDGYSVTSSKEHLFRVIDESGEYVWRQAANISPGDVMALRANYITETENVSLDTSVTGGEKNAHSPTLPSQMSSELAEWLGFVIGDGHVRDSGVRVAFDNRDDSDERFADLTEQLFNIPAATRERSDADCTIVSANSVEVVRYIRQNEMSKPSSQSAYVPDVVRNSGRDAVTSFLSSLFDADGSVEERSISLYTNSEELASSVQQLLLGVGIDSRLTQKRDGYRVAIRKNEDGRRFVESVGFVSSRKRSSSERFATVSSNATTTKIPNQQELLREWCHNTEEASHELYKRISQFIIDAESPHSQDISREFIDSIRDEYPVIDESPPAELAEKDLVFKQVESITDAGVVRATDLHVPRRNTFVANGFVSHNSPTLMNAGAELQQLSACFLLEVGDSMAEQDEFGRESILDTVKHAGQIFKSGGGVGYTFSHLRPKGAHITSTDSETSGPMQFMRLFDEVCNTVKQGGCIAASSRVMTDDGYKPLSTVHDAPPMTDDYSRNKLVRSRDGEYHAVLESSDSGPMDAVTLTTEMGYELVGTPNHPILVISDGELTFVPLGEITSDDVIALDQSDKRIAGVTPLTDSDKYPTQMTSDLARFIGLLWADGTFDESNNRLVFTLGKNGNADQNSKRFLEQFADDIDESLIVRDEEPRGKGACWRCVINSVDLINWMEENDLDKSETLAELPEPLYESTETIGDFLGGLTADAHTAIDANTYEYSTADKDFASEIQELLLLCGVPSRVSEIPASEDRYSDKEIYTVRVSPGCGAEAFNNSVTHFLDNDGMVFSDGGERQNKIPFADTLVGRVLSEHFEKNRKLPEGVDASAMKELRRYERGERTPSLNRLRSCFKSVGISPDSIEELSEKYLYDAVASVEESGEEYVYDIEVMDGEHEYVASNFIVHNKRRGAQMAIMRADHPDIGRFAVSKREEGAFANFNISSAITDEFKEAVENNETYTLYDPQTDFDEPFEVVQQTAHFYNKEYADSPETVVDENVWRDHADSIEAWDWEQNKTISLREKWAGEFNLTVGEPMELPARFIWDLILDGAWRNGEPGLFYMDETNRKHSFDVEEHPEYRINATNPSLVAGTPVLTDDGVKPIEELEDTTFKTRSLNNNWAEASCWKSGEDEELYEITTNTGFTYEATPQHEWPVVSDGSVSKKRSDELEAGDFVPLTETDSLEYGNDGGYSDGLLIGWLYGDGSITTRTEENRADFQYDFTISEEDANAGILEFIVQKLKEITGIEYSPTERNRGGEDWYEIHACNEAIVEYMDSFDVSEKSSGIPDSIWNEASETFRKGFVDGLFSADGHVSEQNSRITLTTSRSQIAEDIVSLLSYYGVKAQQRESVSELDGNEHERHDVTISNTPALRFRELFKLSHDNKQQSLERLSEPEYTTVKSSCVKIESVSKSEKAADVWDISVLDESHTFPIAGITTGNCAEQPLCNYEACNLGHVNLSLMMEEDSVTFDKWLAKQEHEFDRQESAVHEYLVENVDWEQIQDVVHTGTRFLDNVVTMSDFPIEQIDDTVEAMRKIGVGVMGWAQMCYQMGIRYGSHESLEAARVVMNFIDKEATAYSHELAKERGSFDAWDDSKYANPTEYKEWFRERAHEAPSDWEDGYPLRNHNITTVAPTGTTSMIGDTSGGIEPVHSVVFYKNVGNDIQGDDMLVEWDSYFLQTLEHNGIDVDAVKKQARQQMRENEFDGVRGLDVPEKIKEIFVTTDDLSSVEHGMMQRAFQEKTDSGISKTVNLPKEATHADVHNAYMLALADGDEKFGAPIKGLTVYRDQSRKEQVVTTQQHSDKEVEEAKELLKEVGYEVEKSTESEPSTEPVSIGGDD